MADSLVGLPNSLKDQMEMDPIKNDRGLITTSGVIIALKYTDGIILATDHVVCYGSQFKFNDVPHTVELSPTCLFAATGELAHFQELTKTVSSCVRSEQCKSGGRDLTSAEIFTLIKRLLYQHRSKIQPLFMQAVIAGVDGDTSFLGVCDEYGTNWEDNIIATGIARYMRGLQLDQAVGKSKEEVIEAIRQVAIGVKARSIKGVGDWDIFDITKNGIKNIGVLDAQPRWAGFARESAADATDGWTRVESIP